MSGVHAVYAPSSAHQWSICTASAEAAAHLPEQEDGEEAIEGTAAHDEIERCLGPLCETKPTAYPVSNPVDPKHAAAYGVALVIDYVRQLVEQSPQGRLWVEQRVELTKDIWGRCDVAHYDPITRTLTIVDYKNGLKDVDVIENAQLRIYAAATIFTRNIAVDWIRYVIVQPNSVMPVPRVKQWAENAADLYAFAERIAAIPAGEKKFVAGEHCRYCPLFGQCPPTQDLLAHLSVALSNPPDAVPLHQVVTFAALKKPIEHWFESFDKANTKRALAGKGIPTGMKLVTTIRHRDWKDPVAARAKIVAEKGVNALELPSPAAAEKLGINVDDLAHTPPGNPALAFDSDKRKPWAPKSAKEMFAAAVDAERAKDKGKAA